MISAFLKSMDRSGKNDLRAGGRYRGMKRLEQIAAMQPVRARLRGMMSVGEVDQGMPAMRASKEALDRFRSARHLLEQSQLSKHQLPRRLQQHARANRTDLHRLLEERHAM